MIVTSIKIDESLMTLEEFISRKKEPEIKEQRFSAKCFTRETQILTTEGYKSFGDFVPEINAGEFVEFTGNFKCIDETGEEREISHTYFDYSDEIISFELEDGSKLDVTPSHKVIIIRDDEEIEVRADEVLSTDYFISFVPEKSKIKMNKLSIKSIQRRKFEKSIPVYCVNVLPFHRIIVNNGIVTKQSINFGFEFGQIAYSFTSTLKAEWSIEKAKEYVQTNNLTVRQHKIYKNELEKINNPSDDSLIVDRNVAIKDALEFSYFLASSEDIRKKFFEVYSGLAEWHIKQHNFAKEHGYIQSLWGPIRRLPFLVYEGANDEKGRFKNYENISLNSPVQNWEVMYMMYNMSRLHKDIIDMKLKSFLIGNVHDSVISYIHKDETEIMKELFIKYFHQDMPELMLGIPYILEGSLSDYSKGEFWHVIEQPWF